MNSMKDKILLLIEKCEELKESKLIMSTKKISDILKYIASNTELLNLFDSLTSNFNYPEYKYKCLITLDDGIECKNYVVLPTEVDKTLAFIFCLFMEIDRRTFEFNDFLQIYFGEDKSLYASHQAFCKTIVTGFEDALRQLFKDFFEDDKVQHESLNVMNNKANLVAEILVLIEYETKFLKESKLAEDEIVNGLKILEGIGIAVKEGNLIFLEGLAYGYNYFIIFNEYESDNSTSLFDALNEFWRLS